MNPKHEIFKEKLGDVKSQLGNLVKIISAYFTWKIGVDSH